MVVVVAVMAHAAPPFKIPVGVRAVWLKIYQIVRAERTLREVHGAMYGKPTFPKYGIAGASSTALIRIEAMTLPPRNVSATLILGLARRRPPHQSVVASNLPIRGPCAFREPREISS